MKKFLAIGIATAGALTFATTASAAHDRGDLTIGLNGANEVGEPGDKDGSGKIHLEFFAAVDNDDVVFPNQPYVCYELTVRNIDDALLGLHIHEVDGNTKNPRKDTGDVVVNLMPKEGSRGSGDATCVAVNEEIFDGIQEDPSEYYVNAHNAAHPAGAIRGQLHAFN